MDLHLHAYLQHLLETAHHTKVSDMPAPLAEKMLADLRIQLEQRLTTNLLDQLSEADQQAYGNLIETDPNQSAVLEFLNSKISNATQIVQTTLQTFEQEYIQSVNYKPKA